ncbi:MAG: acetylornithine transaminase [Thermodesulfobacteriota bacterium]
MKDTKTLIADSQKYIANTYSRFPLVLVRGQGCKVWSSDGREYFDFVAGLAVCNLGHCHPRVVQAIQDQSRKLIHVSNFYHIEPQIELARLLVEHSFADRVFFCNSGAEANEAAMKLAKKYAKDAGRGDRFEFITMEKSFHGRTMAAMSATGQEKIQKGFDPMVPGFKYVPFNDMDALLRGVTPHTCAIMVEPIQGEGGVNCPSEGYLRELRELCRERGILLIFDEVQVGMGRTGKLFAHEHEGVYPDIMTLAKSLAGGVPIGAMLATEEVAKSFIPGTHASTFGGNPLATAAGVAALSVLLEDEVLENCRRVGDYFLKRLMDLKGKHPFINEVRGRGLIIGMELDFEGAQIVTRCMEEGFLINCTMGNVLRFLPPLIISSEEVDQLIGTLDGIFGECEEGAKS